MLNESSIDRMMALREFSLQELLSNAAGVTTRADASVQGFASVAPERAGYLNIPILGGLLEGLGDTIGVAGSFFRADGATVNYFTGESLSPGRAFDAKFMAVAGFVPLARLEAAGAKVGSQFAKSLTPYYPPNNGFSRRPTTAIL